MAEDEDGVSNKKSGQNLNNGGSSQENEQNRTELPYFPRLVTSESEEAKYNNNENGDASPADAKKPTGATRKEDNPFSFRHFLKRDLSLPGNSTYENTGARPKVYANTVQHSPAEPAPSPRTDTQAKENSTDASNHHASDNTSSSSSVEASFSVVDNSESKHNLYMDNSEGQFYRPSLEPLGMPSLPDFVQDHILVEQAYLNSNGPISVDLDNLPDFTFNTSFNAGSSSSLGRRNNSNYSGGSRGYDYESYMGAASSSGESGQGRVPLDLPPGAEVAPGPDLSAHLSLDLTESVNPADRRNMSPRSTFPLDLPPNAGAESMRLPDFLPVHPAGPARTSPEPAPAPAQPPQLLEQLERTRTELFAERARRSRLEGELAAARDAARRRDACRTPADGDSTVAQLKNQIKRLKEELAASQEEVRSLRGSQARAARDLRHASTVAETSLRELLAGLEQLKSLSTSLEPT
ncbi:lethal (3) 04053 isoform X2 [Choristoneura fumiferana]|uniref:lethal (3) 04053 isoform X2 n=1 Tax=Choristoneura fumiferana TaxID=7141 RepID=UPI003D15EF3D